MFKLDYNVRKRWRDCIRRLHMCLRAYLPLAGVAFLAATSSFADTYNYTGQVQTWTVETTGIYDISVWGAQGGSATPIAVGGSGALVGGQIRLESGTVVSLVVGGHGLGGFGTGAGGGGGSFVFTSDGLLAAAGGGGGSDWRTVPGQDAQISQSGGGALGGTDGLGGGGVFCMEANPYYCGDGGGGGGWLGNGEDSGPDFPDYFVYAGPGGLGGPDFGSTPSQAFGGGGGYGYNGGGGGGGYSGGGADGGGGGSYLASEFTNTVLQAGARQGDGQIEIDFLSAAPEPSTWGLMIFGLGSIGAVLRRQRLSRRPACSAMT